MADSGAPDRSTNSLEVRKRSNYATNFSEVDRCPPKYFSGRLPIGPVCLFGPSGNRIDAVDRQARMIPEPIRPPRLSPFAGIFDALGKEKYPDALNSDVSGPRILKLRCSRCERSYSYIEVSEKSAAHPTRQAAEVAGGGQATRLPTTLESGLLLFNGRPCPKC